MHLAIDARLLQAGGIGTYLREILAPWLRDPSGHAPGLSTLTLLGRPGELVPWLSRHPTSLEVRVVRWEDGSYSPTAHLRWPLFLAPQLRRVDHLFFPHWNVPLHGIRAPFTVTVHDLTQFVLPELFPSWKRRVGIRVLRRAAERARTILTVSRHTASDLGRMGIGNPERVRVIANGVGAAFTPDGPSGGRLPEVRDPYLLLVGWDRPHKNAELAVRVVAELADGEGEGAPTLVLVGEGGRMREPIVRLVAELGVADRVLFAGRVPHDHLPPLYRGAAAVLAPSRYEGFGLPALEGMACGAPVLVSDGGSLPEVAGPAPILPSEDTAGWVAAVREVLGERGSGNGSASLEARALRVAHAGSFRWEDASREVFSVLNGGEGGRR